ncbi:MAG TPA: GNAT family N-acetyltransferase [Pyrinomonadaceae bacterium]|jgi:CelD/BcsL family acetyltransferase involved in cellulose biosynthesis
MSRILIEKADDENVFDDLREEWKQLFAASHCAPFLAWEWLSVWYKWFGAGRKPFVLKAFRENRLIGIFPLCRQEKKVLGMRLRRLAFIGEAQGGADYLDLIAAPEDKAEILKAIFDFLKKENCFDLISLENVSIDSAIAGFLQNFAKRQAKPPFRQSAQASAVCPQIDLAGGWETVLKNSKRASNFKRRLKQLEKMPDFEFRSVTSRAETAEAFERFFRLHEKRWSKNGGSELSGHPRLVSFQRDLVNSLGEAGLLRFDELWAAGECRASVYGLDDRRNFYYYNSGYDSEWASFSVGLVLIGVSVKSAIERGCETYDFLRGDEGYKFDWATSRTELMTINFSRRTAPAIAHEGINRAWLGLRNFSKSALPFNLVETLKTHRRAWKRNRELANLKPEKSREIYES